MRRTEALQGVRMAMFLNILNRWESAELNEEEAAELLGVSERTFRRWRNRYDEGGEAGLLDQRLGKASGKRVPIDRAGVRQRSVALLHQRRMCFSLTKSQLGPRPIGQEPGDEPEDGRCAVSILIRSRSTTIGPRRTCA